MAAIPTGWLPIRSILESAGYNVGWDPNSRQITGNKQGFNPINMYSGSYQIEGDRAYADPNYIQSLLAGNKMTQQYSTQNATDFMSKMFDPMRQASQDRLNLMTKKIANMANEQRSMEESGYDEARFNLGKNEEAAKLATTHSVAGRNISGSPLAEYQRRKVKEAYAPQQRLMEDKHSSALANIAQRAAIAQEEMASQAQQLEAQYIKDMMSGALGMYDKERYGDTNFNQLLQSLGSAGNNALQGQGMNYNFAANMAPYFMQNQNNRYQLPYDYSQLFGSMTTPPGGY